MHDEHLGFEYKIIAVWRYVTMFIFCASIIACLVGGLIGERGKSIIKWMVFSTHAKNGLENFNEEFKKFEDRIKNF